MSRRSCDGDGAYTVIEEQKLSKINVLRKIPKKKELDPDPIYGQF